MEFVTTVFRLFVGMVVAFTKSNRKRECDVRHSVDSITHELEAELRMHSAPSRNKMCSKPPLFMRKWVPYACLTAIFLIWMPDRWISAICAKGKSAYTQAQFMIHREYWRFRLPHHEFAALLKEIEEEIPKEMRIPHPECPL